MDFVRNRRTSADVFSPVSVSVERRAGGGLSGMLQSLANVLVYLLVFLVFFRSNLQYMGMFIAFMVASVLAQLLFRFGKSFRRMKRFPYLQLRTNAQLYKEHLAEAEAVVDKAIADYIEHVAHKYYSVQSLKDIALRRWPELWHRLPSHADFLDVNLGYASQAFPVTVQYPKLSYIERDGALEAFRTRVEAKIQNEHGEALPHAFPLKTHPLLAVKNEGMTPEQFLPVLNGLVLDLAVMHSPAELALAILFKPEMDLYWTRFLPHVWSGSYRMVNDGSVDVTQCIDELIRLAAREERHLVLVIDADVAVWEKHYRVLNAENLPRNLHVIFFSSTGNVPSRVRHHLKVWFGSTYFLSSFDEPRKFNPLHADSETCAMLARKLFNTRLIDNRITSVITIPNHCGLYELFGVTSAQQIPKASLAENEKICRAFAVPVGVSEEARPVALNLSEHGDGPHCLITGSTGSGKSELLQTFLLSACLKFNPEYFSFVMIDFKGGSISSKVRELPHYAGEFSNGSGAVTKRHIARILALLESEVEYRGALLRQHACDNLAAYHALYARGRVQVALPLLVVAVDEVAVFFSADSEAADSITRLATVGRSFGIHLLLATQAKSGVIYAQIQTNLNGRVEFFSHNDSQTTPAAGIKGRADLRSSAMGACSCQVATASASAASADGFYFIRLDGSRRTQENHVAKSQFEEAVEEICRRYPKAAASEKLHEVLTLPLEQHLEKDFSVQQLGSETAGMFQRDKPAALIGIADNLFSRRRSPFWFSLSPVNLLIYGMKQTGKTTLLKTLIASIASIESGLTPNQIVILIATRNPSEFDACRFPQVHDIVSVDNLYYLLLHLLQELERRRENPRLASVPLLAMFDGCQDELLKDVQLSGMLERLSSEASKFNISLLVTALQKMNLGSSALRYFDRVMAFGMGEGFDYSSLLKLDVITQLPPVAGRFLTNLHGVEGCSGTLEVQCALPAETEQELKGLSDAYRVLWGGKSLPTRVPVMPDNPVFPQSSRKQIAVGLARDLRTCVWDLDQAHTYAISYAHRATRDAFVAYLCAGFEARGFECIHAFGAATVAAATRSGSLAYHPDPLVQAGALVEMTTRLERRTVIVQDDFVRLMASAEWMKRLEQLIDHPSGEVFLVFSDAPHFFSKGRSHSSYLVQKLESVQNGVLIGSQPDRHTFGFASLTGMEQSRILREDEAVSVSPNGVHRMRIARGG